MISGIFSQREPSDVIPFDREITLTLTVNDLPFEVFHSAVVSQLTYKERLDYKMQVTYDYVNHLNLIGVDRDNIERVLWTFVIPNLGMTKQEVITLFQCLAANAASDRRSIAELIFESVLTRCHDEEISSS